MLIKLKTQTLLAAFAFSVSLELMNGFVVTSVTTPHSGGSVLTVLTAFQKNAMAQLPTDSNTQNQQTDKSLVLTDEQVNAIARQTTVMIGQGLQKGDLEAKREFNPGSGVLVAKRDKTYYVATNLHVVRGRGGLYGVRTYDGEVHPVDDENTSSNIHLFGQEQGENGQTISGFDLAIVQFESNKDYPLATINPTGISQSDKVFVSGWPDPEARSARRERYFSPGQVTAITPASPDGGYGLVYNCATQRGMSGGPVFNAKGEVVGIHGRAGEAKGLSSLDIRVAHLTTQTKSTQAPAPISPATNDIYNLGIRVNYLMTEAQVAQSKGLIPPDLIFRFPPVDLSILKSKIDQHKADVIENIYNIFENGIFGTGRLRRAIQKPTPRQHFLHFDRLLR